VDYEFARFSQRGFTLTEGNDPPNTRNITNRISCFVRVISWIAFTYVVEEKN
jgi:hypothetical protein